MKNTRNYFLKGLTHHRDNYIVFAVIQVKVHLHITGKSFFHLRNAVYTVKVSLLVVRLFSCSMHIPSHWLVRCCVVTATQQELDKMIKRNAALSALFKRLYKDNVLGKIAMSSSRCCLLTTTPSRSNWPQPYQRNRHGWRSWKLLPPTWYLHWES